MPIHEHQDDGPTPDPLDSGSWVRADDRARSIEAEQSVLGAQLLDPSCRAQLCGLVAADFSYGLHRRIQEAIDATDGGDAVTVLEQLRRWGEDEAIGGLAYLTELQAAVPSRARVTEHAAIVRARACERKQAALRHQAAALLRSGDDLAAVRELLDRLQAQGESTAPERFPLLGAADLRDLPPLSWRVRGLLPAQGIAAIYGPSGSGKSFLQIDMMAAGCEGGEWFGHRVKPGRWVYLALEGQAAIRQRVEAWERHHERPFPEAARFMFKPFKVTAPADVGRLAASIEAAGGADVVVIDTLNRAAPEADENSSADMGRIIDGAAELQRLTGGLVVFVHHAGKDPTKGPRGHSSLFAALDAVISVTREGERREWSVSKAKDGEDGAAHPFTLEVVDLGEDEEGLPIASCVVAGAPRLDKIPERVKLPQGGNQRIAYDALLPLLKESRDYGRASAPPNRPCLDLERTLPLIRAKLPVSTDRQTERAREAIKGLVSRGVLGFDGGWLWLK